MSSFIVLFKRMISSHTTRSFIFSLFVCFLIGTIYPTRNSLFLFADAAVPLEDSDPSCYGQVLGFEVYNESDFNYIFNLVNGTDQCLPTTPMVIVPSIVRKPGVECAVNNVILKMFGPEDYYYEFKSTTLPYQFSPEPIPAGWDWPDGFYTVRAQIYGGTAPPYKSGNDLEVTIYSDCGRTDPPTQVPTHKPTTFPTIPPTKAPTLPPTEPPTLAPSIPLLREGETWPPTVSPAPSTSPTLHPTACVDPLPRVEGFTLIDRVLKSDIAQISYGDSYNLATMPSKLLDVRVNIVDCPGNNLDAEAVATDYSYSSRPNWPDVTPVTLTKKVCDLNTTAPLIPLDLNHLTKYKDTHRILASPNARPTCRGLTYEQVLMAILFQNTVNCGGIVSSVVAFDTTQQQGKYQIKDGSTVCLQYTDGLETRTIAESFCEVTTVEISITGPEGFEKNETLTTAADTPLVWNVMEGESSLFRLDLGRSGWPTGAYTLTMKTNGTSTINSQKFEGDPTILTFFNDCGTVSPMPSQTPTGRPTTTRAPITSRPTTVDEVQTVSPTTSPSESPTSSPSSESRLLMPSDPPVGPPSAALSEAPTTETNENTTPSPSIGGGGESDVPTTLLPTRSPSPTQSVTPTRSPTHTPSLTQSVTHTRSPTHTPSPTQSVTPTRSPTHTPSPTQSVPPTAAAFAPTAAAGEDIGLTSSPVPSSLGLTDITKPPSSSSGGVGPTATGGEPTVRTAPTTGGEPTIADGPTTGDGYGPTDAPVSGIGGDTPLDESAPTATPTASGVSGGSGGGNQSPTRQPAVGTPRVDDDKDKNCVSGIDGWTLVDSDINVDLQPLVDGSGFDYASLPTRNVHMRVDFKDCGDVGSIATEYKNNGIVERRCDEDTPFSESLKLLRKKRKGLVNFVVNAESVEKEKKKKGKRKDISQLDFSGRNLEAQQHQGKSGKNGEEWTKGFQSESWGHLEVELDQKAGEINGEPRKLQTPTVEADPQAISATLYTGSNCDGEVVDQSAIAFDVSNSVDCLGKVTSFVVFDAMGRSRLFQINEGDTICIPEKTTIEARSIRLNGGNCEIKHVYMKLKGPMKWRRMATGQAPYTIHGPSSIPQAVWPNGFYTIKAQTVGRTKMDMGEMLVVDFVVKC